MRLSPPCLRTRASLALHLERSLLLGICRPVTHRRAARLRPGTLLLSEFLKLSQPGSLHTHAVSSEVGLLRESMQLVFVCGIYFLYLIWTYLLYLISTIRTT